MRISGNEFKGVCEECGDLANLKPVPVTALLQTQDGSALLSAVATDYVYCESGHGYFVLKLETMVMDPFAPGEMVDTSPLGPYQPPAEGKDS